MMQPIPGLDDAQMAYVVKVFAAVPGVARVVLFGSRAKGTWKLASDIDLAVYGPGVNLGTIARLKAALEDEGPLPYRVGIELWRAR